MNVIASMERAFREHPERRALWAADGACSYRELGASSAASRRSSGRAVPARIGVLTGDDVAPMRRSSRYSRAAPPTCR